MMLLRSARVARPALRHVRSLHIENRVNETIPGGCHKKGPFAVRFFAIYSLGLALPFAATKYMMVKAGSSE